MAKACFLKKTCKAFLFVFILLAYFVRRRKEKKKKRKRVRRITREVELLVLTLFGASLRKSFIAANISKLELLERPFPGCNPSIPSCQRLVIMGKSRRRRAYPQQIVTTGLLYCLQDPFAQLSRLQRI